MYYLRKTCRRAHFVPSCLQTPSPLWHWEMIQKKVHWYFSQPSLTDVPFQTGCILVLLLSQDTNNLFLPTAASEQGSRETSLCCRAHRRFPLSSQGTEDLKFHVFSLLLLDPACSIQQTHSPPALPSYLITTQPILYSPASQCLNTTCRLTSRCTPRTISIYLNMKLRFFPYNTLQTRYLMYYSFSGRETTIHY